MEPIFKSVNQLVKYEALVSDWKDCIDCNLYLCRLHRPVHYRGYLPCDLLFVGEAPGSVEDLHGVPFIGPAGKLLDKLIAEVLYEDAATPDHPSIRCGFTNVVACFPRTEDGKPFPPPSISIVACRNRLIRTLQIARPKLAIIAVGKTAQVALQAMNLSPFKCPLLCIPHTAYMLRQGGAKSAAYQAAVRMLDRFLSSSTTE
jgi:DNA polymerase